MTQKLYIIDVDGTVADNTHREHFIHQETPDWDSFFLPEQMSTDVPIESALAHFDNGKFVHGDHIFLTARVESTVWTTVRWLINHGFAPEAVSGFYYNEMRGVYIGEGEVYNPYPVGSVIAKPDFMRCMRSRVFKPTVLDTLQKYYFPERELILIEDYGEVRRSVEEAGFKCLHAPDCWDDEDCWS